MPATQAAHHLPDEEPRYSRSVFEAIVACLGDKDPALEAFDIRADGAYLRHPDTDGTLAWHPWCEVSTPGSPNPLDEPWLPFPFTAKQLAALMVDGWGYFIQERYGAWGTGPDEDALRSIGPLGTKAREALHGAYAAYRHAQALAPRLDPKLEERAQQLTHEYSEAREAAMVKEALREHKDSQQEYSERLGRVNESVAALKQTMTEARLAADLAQAAWRQAMVQHLLLPVELVDEDCFECLLVRGVPPELRARVLGQLQAQTAFLDSETGKVQWELMAEQGRLEAELHRWQKLAAPTVSEARDQETKLKQLQGELASVNARLEALVRASPPSGDVDDGAPPAEDTTDFSRLATPDQLLKVFQAFGLKPQWFSDLNSHQWLLDARRIKGQAGRSHRRDPWFCPYAVMVGLTQKKRKGRMRAETGWRLLESHFPGAYLAVSAGDPRESSG